MASKGIMGLAGVTLAGILGASSANAAVVLSDNFDAYTNGNLSGQGGWTATASAATPMQVAGDADKYVQLATGQDEYKAFSTAVNRTDGDSIATSFTANVATATANGDYFSHLSSPAGTTTFFYQRIFARSLGSGFQLGLLDTSGTGSAITYGAGELALGTEHDVDVTWNFVAGGNNDTFTMTVNGTPYLTHTWTSVNAEPATLEAANLRQAAGNAASVQFDDYVVDAVPEPTSLGLLAAGAGMLAGRRARRRVNA